MSEFCQFKTQDTENLPGSLKIQICKKSYDLCGKSKISIVLTGMSDLRIDPITLFPDLINP